MGSITRFEDLIAWQKARDLARELYQVTAAARFRADLGLRDQIRRASVSVMANLAEGFERGSSREFHQFLVIAKGSCAEVRSHLYVAQDVGYLTAAQSQELQTSAVQLGRILGALRAAVDRKRTRQRQ